MTPKQSRNRPFKSIGNPETGLASAEMALVTNLSDILEDDVNLCCKGHADDLYHELVSLGPEETLKLTLREAATVLTTL